MDIDKILNTKISRKKFLGMIGASFGALIFFNRGVLADIWLRDTDGSQTNIKSFVKREGDAMTGTLLNVEEAQLRNIELVSSEPDAVKMVGGTIYLVYEDV